MTANFPPQIPGCDSHSLLFGIISLFDAGIYSRIDFPALGKSDHIISVSTDSQSNSKRDGPFHRIAYDYSKADWDGLHDHLRGIPSGTYLG